VAILLLTDWISVEQSKKRLNAYQATDCDDVLFWLLVPSGGRIESGSINMASHHMLASN